ncbi:hypothetical protein L3X38_039127 [Prunus dulcis]|uniref:Retrovirus-related Pol polyprotein from transposon RE1 n=1 Tax=Prunus dulcis TaxID=3755 RepID=A0AAD4YSA6_PRUDU|nr:hypothetical protein L3X38_039127 [Prunus dulcis]
MEHMKNKSFLFCLLLICLAKICTSSPSPPPNYYQRIESKPIHLSLSYRFPCSSALMATESATILNTNATHQNLISINVAAQAPLKLSSTNYLSWKLQFQSLFIGYDLLGYIDGSKPCPPPTLTQDNTTSPNPSYSLWIRQDQLILNAIIGFLSPTIISFIAQAKTSKQAWTILANTYAKPSRGRIKQIKQHLKNTTKG